MTPNTNQPTEAERAAAREDARVAAASDARAMRRLAPTPRLLVLVGGGISAALIGGLFGYWLGSRRAARTPGPVRHLAATADSLVALAPVAVSLMQNPMIRALVLRLLVRQVTSRLPG